MRDGIYRELHSRIFKIQSPEDVESLRKELRVSPEDPDALGLSETISMVASARGIE